MRGLLRDSGGFRQPLLALSSLFRDLFCSLFGTLFDSLFGSLLYRLLGEGLARLLGRLFSGFGGFFGRFRRLFGCFSLGRPRLGRRSLGRVLGGSLCSSLGM